MKSKVSSGTQHSRASSGRAGAAPPPQPSFGAQSLGRETYEEIRAGLDNIWSWGFVRMRMRHLDGKELLLLSAVVWRTQVSEGRSVPAEHRGPWRAQGSLDRTEVPGEHRGPRRARSTCDVPDVDPDAQLRSRNHRIMAWLGLEGTGFVCQLGGLSFLPHFSLRNTQTI